MGLIRYAGYDPSEHRYGRPPTKTCKNGHLRTEANTSWVSRGNKRWRVCLQCKAISGQKCYRRNKSDHMQQQDGR